ncbi:oligosaccharide flippase family protein [Streptomyces sp. NBC_01304]|uniref:oligosaccharide flippase family protein n=1 Tax=Streptomyces sp. NBC_01304 TaxID=2903818 RepID=UPI002E0DB6F6|nr:oligosaccharide flippase family protein [Streptomyces sp. NBC_01304]
MTRARSAVRSVAWNYGGSVAAVVLQLGYTALTSRLVTPAAFGAYATALTVAGVLSYLSNSGIGTTLLAAERLTRPLTSLALRIGLVSGVLCFLAGQGAASALGLVDAMPEAEPLLRLLALQFLCAPLAAAATAALRRCGLVVAVVLLEITGQFTGIAVSATLLISGSGPYGLAVASPLASGTVLAGSLWLLHRQRLPDGPRPTVRELLGSSGFFSGHSLFQYMSSSAPLWVTGARLGPTAAGHYSRASMFTGLPLTFLATGINRTTTPMLAENRGSSPQAVYDVVCAASAVGLVGFGAAAGLGPAALNLLLGPGWTEAALLVPVLAVGAACSLLAAVGDSVDQARDDRRALLRSQLCATAAAAVTLGVAALQGSLLLAAAAAVTAPLCAHAAQLLRWRRHDTVPVRDVLHAHAVHALAGGSLLVGCRWASAGHLPLTGLLTGLVTALPLAGCAFLLRTRLPLYAVARRRGLTPSR